MLPSKNHAGHLEKAGRWLARDGRVKDAVDIHLELDGEAAVYRAEYVASAGEDGGDDAPLMGVNSMGQREEN